MVDLSVGNPSDPPPPVVAAALADSTTARSYPASIGSAGFRHAAIDWVSRRFGVEVALEQVAACIGTKELVAGLPHLLRLRTPDRDTVLYPAISYPTYAMGATLAGGRAVPISTMADGTLDLASISDADVERALCLWVNSPANPTGALDDLDAAARWGRQHGVPVLSDECYAEFTWDGPPRTILESGDAGVLAVHSLSKRSNLAGLRAGCYVGDGELVSYLSEVRKHAGAMVPGPVQDAAIAAWCDQSHVDMQRDRYRARLETAAELVRAAGATVELPGGAFYLWAAAPDGDAWGFASLLAEQAGVLVSPGDFYGPDGAGHVRVAAVAPTERLELALERLSDT
jgi:aspartate/methionine/tyrosine aminotransferase